VVVDHVVAEAILKKHQMSEEMINKLKFVPMRHYHLVQNNLL
jgi:hypothetical protein